MVTNQEHNVAAMAVLETRDDTSCLSQTYLETVRILGWPRRSSSNSGVEVQRMSTVPFLFGLHSQICRWRTYRNATDFDEEYHRRSCLATASDFLYSTPNCSRLRRYSANVLLLTGRSTRRPTRMLSATLLTSNSDAMDSTASSARQVRIKLIPCTQAFFFFYRNLILVP